MYTHTHRVSAKQIMLKRSHNGGLGLRNVTIFKRDALAKLRARKVSKAGGLRCLGGGGGGGGTKDIPSKDGRVEMEEEEAVKYAGTEEEGGEEGGEGSCGVAAAGGEGDGERGGVKRRRKKLKKHLFTKRPPKKVSLRVSESHWSKGNVRVRGRGGGRGGRGRWGARASIRERERERERSGRLSLRRGVGRGECEQELLEDAAGVAGVTGAACMDTVVSEGAGSRRGRMRQRHGEEGAGGEAVDDRAAGRVRKPTDRFASGKMEGQTYVSKTFLCGDSGGSQIGAAGSCNAHARSKPWSLHPKSYTLNPKP